MYACMRVYISTCAGIYVCVCVYVCGYMYVCGAYHSAQHASYGDGLELHHEGAVTLHIEDHTVVAEG
jgi:hypothetical protein